MKDEYMNTGKATAYIDIVFDGPPSHESGRFVEVENQTGKSINFGEWIDRGDGLWALRLPSMYTPVEIAIALSLYGFNVPAWQRAKALYQHFAGDCMEEDDLFELLNGTRSQYVATELPYPTAKVYVENALARYGEEARKRCAIEEDGYVA